MQSLVRALFIVFCVSPAAHGQVFDEQFDHWPVNLKINGRIVIARSLEHPELLKPLLPEDAREVHVVVDPESTLEDLDSYLNLFKPDVTIPDQKTEEAPAETSADVAGKDEDPTDESEDDEARFAITMSQLGDPLGSDDLAEADVVLFLGSDEADASVMQQYHEELKKAVDNGNTLVAIGPLIEALGVSYTSDDQQFPSQQPGLGLLPDCIIEAEFDGQPRAKNRLLSLLAAAPRCVGIGLADNTALILSGRKMLVSGDGSATAMLMANERQPLRVQTIVPAASRRRYSTASLLDLTEWRRDAIDRTLPQFPPEQPRRPYVENGTLVIVGGGGMPDGLMDQIVELAGGREEARMVYIPCSEREDVGERQSTVESWKRMGVQHATFIHTKDRVQANEDEEFLKPLREATGLWFGGGRQWNFADSYYGTTAHKLMKEVLQRGGVIGGSSAGASIQARYLARATPIGNFDIMAPGYERGGLGFISGVAIDQHFSQRGRQKDLTQLVNRYPQMLGIGIDEATAIIVQQSEAEVVGRGRVFFYDRNRPVFPDRPDYIALPAGSKFDLDRREVLVDTSGEGNTPDEESENASADDADR